MLEQWQLEQRQNLPLEVKIELSKKKIREWYEHWGGNVNVSFSGGKDSTVLLHLVRNLYPEVSGLFVDTGLEYPEIKEFVKTQDNIEIYRPKMPFTKVIEKYGYPIVSKKVARFVKDLKNPTEKNATTRHTRLTGYTSSGKFCPSLKLPKKWYYLIDAPFKISDQCCDVMKKEPFRRYSREHATYPMTGVMASESGRRAQQYRISGCNAFDGKEPKSSPMAFWTEQDVLRYLRDYNVPYASVYGDIVEDENGKLSTTGVKRTGCMFCMFGVHLEQGENRFQKMKKTHPKVHEYCMTQLGLKEVLEYIKVKYE